MRSCHLNPFGVGPFLAGMTALVGASGGLVAGLSQPPWAPGTVMSMGPWIGAGVGLGALFGVLVTAGWSRRRRGGPAAPARQSAQCDRLDAGLRRVRAWTCDLDARGRIVESEGFPARADCVASRGNVPGAFVDAVQEPDRPRAVRALDRLRSDRPVTTFKCRMRGDEGAPRWYRCLALFRDPATVSGPRIRLIGVEITAHGQTLEPLRRSRVLLAETERLAGIGGWVIDVDTLRGSWTEGLCRIFGVPADYRPELPRDLAFVEPAYRETLRHALERSRTTGAPWELELEIHTALGQRRWVRVLGAVLRREGRVVALRGTCQDITELRKAQETLRFSEERFRLIFENAHDAIFWADPDTGIISNCNRAAEALLERPRDEIVGAIHTLLHPPEKREHYVQLFRQQAETAGDVDCDAEVITRSGKIKPVHITASCTAVGDAAVVQGVFRDVTERVRTEKQLRESHALMVEALQREKLAAVQLEATMEQYLAARDDAEAAARAKTEFLANMSHEIRTPMTAILGFAENLLDPGLAPAERSEMIGTIQRNGSYLLHVLNDILDLSRIEAGKLQIENVAVSPAALAHEVHELMLVRADAKALALELHVDPGVPEWIESDPTRLKQVLVNLVGNAIKFTDRGTITLTVRPAPPGPPERPGLASRIELAIHDTGIGMSAAEIAHLFQPFMQADTTTTRKFGGTGLGLTISKRLAEMLGGDILVESEPGRGSLFRLVIPATPLGHAARVPAAASVAGSRAPAGHAADAPDALPARVLLVEDGPDNQRLVSFLLRRAGATVEIAANGAEAVCAALQADRDGRPYDVVLMDMQMPVMDGYDATRALREQGYDRPIIAVTAHAMATDHQKCLDAGCDHYLSKPIDRKLLIKTVRACLPPRLPALGRIATA